ncbi:MAG: hypothetical protein Kow0099_26280 [Candidatus Abyssubacteria bacterium]
MSRITQLASNSGRQLFRKIAALFLVGFALVWTGFSDLPATDRASAEQLLSRAIENYESLRSYRCRLKLHLTKGEEVQDKQYVFYYQKPNLVRMYVEKGKDEGSTVIFREDGTIRGRREGLLSIFPITLEAGDRRLYSLWDRHFTKSDCGTILEETVDKLDECSSFRIEVIQGGDQFLITQEDGEGFVDQTWLERDKLLLLKKKVRQPNGDELLAIWSDIALNPKFKEDFFSF